VLSIDSPGGAPVASDEIAQAVLAANKTVIAYIRETGASGAYWIASSADHIIANRMSLTGSVGVTGSYIEWAGTLRRFNATYRQYTGGAYKELGSPFTEATAAEEAVYQAKIDLLHTFFIEHVRERRNLTNEQVRAIRTGEPFLGIEAKDLGLVDELGGKATLDAYLRNLTGEEPQYVYYERPKSFVEELGLVHAPRAQGLTDVVRLDAAYTGEGLRT
jgi:protease-4